MLALGGRLELPRVVGRQIKLAGAPGDANSAANTHQPVVFSQGVAGFTYQLVEFIEAAAQVANQLVQSALGDGRVTAISLKVGFLPVQVFHDLGLEVGPSANIQNLKQSDQCKVVVHG